MNSITLNNFDTPNTFKERLAQKVLHLCIQRRVFSSNTEGVVFCVWRRNERFVVAFNADAIDTNLVNDDFCHRLSTRIDGRKVSRTNTIGMFLQVSLERPAVQMPLETRPLDLSQQPTPWHVPVGMTREGALWNPFLEGTSYLIGGSTGGGKTGLEHAWIQALIHGKQTLVYAWDGKRGAEFIRYVGHENFHMMLSGYNQLLELQTIFKAREQMLTESGCPNILMYNEARKGAALMLPIVLFIDEAAFLSDQEKQLLEEMIGLYRFSGLYPVICTNQPNVAKLFSKTNLITRICFRVPMDYESRVVIGYEGAEALPDVRGRGLIVWKGKFVEFQSFEVTYPMPSPDAMRLIMEQLAEDSEQSAVSSPQSEIERLAESIRGQWKPGMSKRATSKLLGKDYAGNSWTAKVDQIIEHLAATTTTAPLPSSLEGAPA